MNSPSAAMKCPDEDGIETQAEEFLFALDVVAAMKCPDEDGIETPCHGKLDRLALPCRDEVPGRRRD